MNAQRGPSVIDSNIRIRNETIFHFMSMKHKNFSEAKHCKFSQESWTKTVIRIEYFYSKGKNYEEMGYREEGKSMHRGSGNWNQKLLERNHPH